VEPGSPAGWSSVPSGPGSVPGGAGAPQPTETGGEAGRGEEPDGTSPRTHPYTFLHMLVLVLVAFVLGMLIFMVVVNEPPDANAAGPAPQSTTHTPTHEAGD
ncbi:hypothetical protein, partial [Actinotalea sp. C106]|uniref:hypothetical protein n=1 Tax=Actinotalea sp. C106 TaxID=2908644 RepID=UPI0035ABF684